MCLVFLFLNVYPRTDRLSRLTAQSDTSRYLKFPDVSLSRSSLRSLSNSAKVAPESSNNENPAANYMCNSLVTLLVNQNCNFYFYCRRQLRLRVSLLISLPNTTWNNVKRAQVPYKKIVHKTTLFVFWDRLVQSINMTQLMLEFMKIVCANFRFCRSTMPDHNLTLLS